MWVSHASLSQVEQKTIQEVQCFAFFAAESLSIDDCHCKWEVWLPIGIGSNAHLQLSTNQLLIDFTFALCSIIFMLDTYLLLSRWLLRFEFQLPHPIISPALATDKKLPLSQFHMSYQNSEISWPKVQISDFQSQLSMSKIIRNFLKKIFHWRISF